MNKVQSQTPVSIRRETFNTLIDAARAEQQRRGNVKTIPERVVRRADTILVRNESGSDVPMGGVLGIGNVIIKPVDNAPEFILRPSLRGVLPKVADHAGTFVVATEPIGDGRIGTALIDGVGTARVRMLSEGDRRADVGDDNVDELVSGGSGGARLLWIEPEPDRQTPGVAWCVVRLDGGGGGAAVSTFRLQSFPSSGQWFGDHVLCRTWDGTNEGTSDVPVLLPDELRMSSWSGMHEFIDGERVDYEPVPGGFPWARIARIDSQGYRETQVITPWYIDAANGGTRGPSIIRCYGADGVAGGLLQSPGYLGETRIAFMDANNAGRAWAEKFTQQVSGGIADRALHRAGVES